MSSVGSGDLLYGGVGRDKLLADGGSDRTLEIEGGSRPGDLSDDYRRLC